MNIGLKFRDALFGKLGQTVREELDQLVASIVQHWLVGHNVDGSHSNAIGSNPGDPVGDRVLNDAMEWVELTFTDAGEGETITGAWTFSTLPVLGTLTGYIKGTAGALSAVTTIPTTDLSGQVTTAQITDAAVTNAKLANMASQTIKLRATAGAGVPEDVAISALPAEAAPAAGDFLLLEESGGTLRKVDWADLPGAGAGESNTASNVGAGGVGVFKQKTGVDLEFKNINAGSGKITVTNDAGNSEVDIDLGAVDLDHLDDVVLTSPASGDVLTFDGTDWVNEAPAAGGGHPDADAKAISAWAAGNNATIASNGFNNNALAVTAGTAPTVSVQAGESVQQNLTTTNVSGNTSNFSLNTHPQIDWGVPFDITFVIRTAASIADLRMWCAIAASAPTASDTYGGGAPARAVFIRYSTVAGDAGWMGGNCDGTTQSLTASSVGAIAASTRYKLRIRSDGSTAYFSVNGGSETSLATNFPGGSTRVGIVVSIYTAAAAVKTMHFQRLYGTIGA
jgi:hypothetical protein